MPNVGLEKETAYMGNQVCFGSICSKLPSADYFEQMCSSTPYNKNLAAFCYS